MTTEKQIQTMIDNSPEDLKKLGQLLTRLLDEDQWPTAEEHLLKLAAILTQQRHSNEGSADRKGLEDIYCQWAADDESIWNTECGELFQFDADGPSENGFRFCPYCGKELAEALHER